MPNQSPEIAILREADGRLALLTNGQQVKVQHSQKLLSLLACFLKDRGRVVPYKRLCKIIGRNSVNPSNLHLLRQHITLLKETLFANKAPYVIAVVHEVGYALCQVAAKPSHIATRNGRTNGASELARNLRQFRIASGLTQTSLAKRSGIKRSALSRLESGRITPTLATLERLAKTLEVTPGYFL